MSQEQSLTPETDAVSKLRLQFQNLVPESHARSLEVRLTQARETIARLEAQCKEHQCAAEFWGNECRIRSETIEEMKAQLQLKNEPDGVPQPPAKRQIAGCITLPEMLEELGFKSLGIDPDAQDHELHRMPGSQISISVPRGGCRWPDIARLIYHAGAADARKDIRMAREAYERQLR